MGVTINNKSPTIESPPKNGQQPKSPEGLTSEGLNAFYWYQIFALDSAVVEVQEMFSSHGSPLQALLSSARWLHNNKTNKLLFALRYKMLHMSKYKYPTYHVGC